MKFRLRNGPAGADGTPLVFTHKRDASSDRVTFIIGKRPKGAAVRISTFTARLRDILFGNNANVRDVASGKGLEGGNVRHGESGLVDSFLLVTDEAVGLRQRPGAHTFMLRVPPQACQSAAKAFLTGLGAQDPLDKAATMASLVGEYYDECAARPRPHADGGAAVTVGGRSACVNPDTRWS